ncbi:MAG TPA: EAL domain-containing protein [Nodosilinea sp.]|nr:EAL domain-containing protein [Nodosilinea sp.]
MYPPPPELPEPISRQDWISTPVNIQRLVTRLLAEPTALSQGIVALKAQIQQEKGLNRVVQAIRNSLDLDTIFATATAEAAQLMAPLDCYVAQLEPGAGEPRAGEPELGGTGQPGPVQNAQGQNNKDLWRIVAEFRHDPTGPSILNHEIPDGGNPLAAQLHRFETVCLDDTDRLVDGANQALVALRPGAWLLTPLVVDGCLWGSFAVMASQRPFTWSPDHRQLAQAVAHQLEVAIQQAHLYRQVQLELSERHRVELALEESQARLQAVAANLPGAIFRYRLCPDGTDGVLYMSPGCSRLWEVAASAVVRDASLLWAMVHPDDRAAMQASVLASAQTLTRWNHAWRITTPSGVEKWLEACGQPIREANGNVIWDTLILDVTDRRRAQVALQASETRFQTLADNVPGVLYGYCRRPDGSDQFTYISSGFREIYGIEPDGALEDSSRLWNTVHPEDAPRLRQTLEESYRSLATWRVQYRALTPTGQVRWLQSIARPIQRPNGEVIWDGLMVDISDRKQAEEALAASEQRLRTIIEAEPECVKVLAADGTILEMNPAGLALLGATDPSQVIGQPVNAFVLPEFHQAFEAVAQRVMAGATEHLVFGIKSLQGLHRWVDSHSVPLRDEHNEIVGILAITRDITESKQTEDALVESEARYRLLAENTNDLVCLHNLKGEYLYVSPSCTALLGYGYDDMRGQRLEQFVHPDDRDRIGREMQGAIAGVKASPVIYRMRHCQGHYRWFETLTRPIADAGQGMQLQTTSRDVTDRVRAQRQLQHDALHDALTGLPNRHQLIARLEQAMHRAQREATYRFGVLFLDLDRFKVINDSLGHQAGDQLLVAIAARLQTALRAADLIARLGGDEFVVLIDDIATVDVAATVATKIFAALALPLTVAGREVYTSASIGIVLGHRGYRQAEHLLRDADIAMYRAKGQGKARYQIFDSQMHTQAMARLQLENDLRRALEAGPEAGELVLHYQPIVDLASGAVVGFEALARWQHPTQGLKYPGDFIPLAEEIGLISALDYWALGAACAQLAAWQRAFPALRPLTVSVNLSAQDLRRADLLATIDRVLATTGLPGPSLTLEITESMLIDDIEATIALLGQIQSRGIQISIDDFGTGYSSLSYLHRLPVDYLKVDRSFVIQAQEGQPNHPILATIMALGTQLGLATVAEGVETPHQLSQLRQLGYALGQGHLFSRALASAQAEALLARQAHP